MTRMGAQSRAPSESPPRGTRPRTPARTRTELEPNITMRSNLFTRLVPVAAVAVLFAAPVSAQSASPIMPKYRFGIAAGANLASMTESDGTDSRTGLLLGANVQVRLNNAFSFQPELYYSQKGLSASEGGTDITLKNDYIEIPLLARWSAPMSGSIRPFALVGPSVGINMSCKLEGEQDGQSESVDCEDFGGEVNTLDLGGLLGGGIEFPVGTRAMSIGARYTFGMNEAIKDSDSKNRALSFLVGFSF